MQRARLKILGQSGSGLLTVGDLFSQALRSLGFQLCSDREYASIIKGGYGCYTINFGETTIRSLSQNADIMVAIDKPSLEEYYHQLVPKGKLIHAFELFASMKDIIEYNDHNNIESFFIPCHSIAKENNGTKIMTNIILLGTLAKIFGMKYETIEAIVRKKFEKKVNIVDIVMGCLHAGYEAGEIGFHVETPKQKNDMRLLNGNHALALGALHGGVQFYAGYPMSPSSSILGYMAQFGPKADIVVRQVEDEITAAQMALGACAAGTRSLTATSGGGFDLMTETLSLAGILEVPFVSIIAQRPGPATGLPTWTAQGDLDLAIHAGHGEFPRIVIGVSNPIDSFRLMQEALNNAEKYQVPVIVLIEKVVCESKMTIPPLEQNTIPIERWLVEEKEFEKIQSSDRYKITESGVSVRWNPGDCEAYYFANGDEHWEMGELEEGERAGEMYEKRMRKLETIKKDLPAPKVYGPETADISFIGWGSSLSIMSDIIALYESSDVRVNYLHYEYVWPLNRESAHDFFEKNKNVHLIENNYTGQFGNKLEFHTESRFQGRLLKWNGRPFFIEDVQAYIQTHI